MSCVIILVLMSRSEFLRQLDELMELEPGTLKGDERLKSLDGWGSLAILGYMAIVNETYHIIVQPQRISGCSTVNDLVAIAQGPA
jgi:acyl carrier protein